MLIFPQHIISILIGIVSIFFGVIAFYTVSVKRTTKKWFFSLPLILILDITARFAGTFHGLIKWLLFKLREK